MRQGIVFGPVARHPEQMIRVALYLFALLPMTWLIATLSLVLPELLLPPDPLKQAMMSLPIFCLVGGWVGGVIISEFIVPSEIRSSALRRSTQRFVFFLHLVLGLGLIALIPSGIVTPIETVALVAAILLIAHGLALRHFLRP